VRDALAFLPCLFVWVPKAERGHCLPVALQSGQVHGFISSPCPYKAGAGRWVGLLRNVIVGVDAPVSVVGFYVLR